MKEALIDTNILSLFFRNNEHVVAKFVAYQEVHERISLSIITYYEIVSGLMHRDAHKQLSSFMAFAEQNKVIGLEQNVADAAATLYAELRKSGQPIDDIDLLIAGTALSHELVLVTHNRKHFDRITGLEIQDWSEST